MVYIIFLCLSIPMVLMVPLLESRSRWIVGFFLLGAVTALAAYEINTIVFPFSGMSARSFTELIPPIVEELLKALPVLCYALLLDDSRKRVLPIAMAVGVGFAVLENTALLVEYLGSVSIAWAAGRGFSASLMHGLCTVTIGTGICYVKKQRKLFYTGTFGLLSIAITMHALFNLLIQSSFDIIGMVMPLALYGLLYVMRSRKKLKLPFLSY
ncbi:MAG: PrsW family glutamic-type intramembrane protease [Clostridium sp.]|nr:PrsW family glutamic-type intramembrane protease [Clostridium sp.]